MSQSGSCEKDGDLCEVMKFMVYLQFPGVRLWR